MNEMLALPLPERRLLRLWRWVRNGLPSDGRYRRYATSVLPVLALIWLATAAYLLLMPKRYASEFSLILPGAGIGSSMNVESIGQAQSSASSAFSSPALSPTQNYKQLLSADVTLRAAARRLGEDEERFPAPTIKLVDQTNLIHLTLPGATPRQAHARAEALRSAFLEQLDQLRADEARVREVADVRHLQDLEAKVRDTQRRLIAFQVKNGLATLDQFNNRIAAVDMLRQRERDIRVAMQQHGGTARRLSGSLGSNSRRADIAMRLRGDPLFQQLAERHAAAAAIVAEKAGTLGPRHAELARASSEADELRAALLRRGRALTGLDDGVIMASVDQQLSDGRSNLMQAMTVNDAQAAGDRAALAEINADLLAARAQSPALIARASELADLQRDHRVAEAVFSSALARLDTNKQDSFASYPLVQTLAAPSLPRGPSSPSTLIALAGAVAATFLVLIAFGLLWLRQPILDRLLRNA
jgi:uncharacterized protein involved in exopolysaccharide biosynthesis